MNYKKIKDKRILFHFHNNCIYINIGVSVSLKDMMLLKKTYIDSQNFTTAADINFNNIISGFHSDNPSGNRNNHAFRRFEQ